MKPTLHLRFRKWKDYCGGDVVIPTDRFTLQQFWHIESTESDITLPRTIHDGMEGRWIDVPTA